MRWDVYGIVQKNGVYLSYSVDHTSIQFGLQASCVHTTDTRVSLKINYLTNSNRFYLENDFHVVGQSLEVESSILECAINGQFHPWSGCSCNEPLHLQLQHTAHGLITRRNRDITEILKIIPNINRLV